MTTNFSRIYLAAGGSRLQVDWTAVHVEQSKMIARSR
jgi:hypothetical protein